MFDEAIPRFDADDDTITQALADADLPALLMCVAAVTGDLAMLTPDIRPDYHDRSGQGGLSEAQQRDARERTLQRLRAYRESGSPEPVAPSEEVLRRIVEWVMGSETEEFLPLLREELVLAHEDPKAPTWSVADPALRHGAKVAIIGAGMSGLAAGYRLLQVGVELTVFEKNDDVGGTWFENRYPGCRVDVNNHLYSYSFATKSDWSLRFSTHEMLRQYFRDVADWTGVREHVRFGAEVTELRWDEAAAQWQVTTVGGGTPEAFDVVISAVGQLNRPLIPKLADLDTFSGPTVHSAQWDPDLDLTGKRVIVVGTGASGVQLIPELAKVTGHLTIVQRTPVWFMPTPDYHDPVADGMVWLFQHVPYYAQWYRFWLMMPLLNGVLGAAEVDPAYPPTERAISAANDELRGVLTAALRAAYADRPDLLARAIPDYPVAAKRMCRDNGNWSSALKRRNVSLVTDAIDHVEAEGLVTADGTLHEADVLVFATGFQAADFLVPMTVVGRDGRNLHEEWAGNARAYLGVTIPGFPNFFTLYGPNTNLVVHGSIIFFSECEVRYVLDAVHHLLANEHRSFDVRADVYEKYNEEVDAMRAWGWSSVNTWYKNSFGRSAQNWPFSVLEFWSRTRHVDPNDYVWR
jgi:4-hydroxyacetophenone monooxygenase